MALGVIGLSGFKFKFAKVLKVKEVREGICRHELLRLLAVEENEKRRLKQMEAARENTRAAQRAEMHGAVSVSRLRLYHEYARLQSAQISGQEQTVLKSAAMVVNEREKLLAARLETKVLTKLKAKHRVRYFLQENRQEQKLIDEAAESKHRRMTEGGY